MQITSTHTRLKEALSRILQRSYPLVYNRRLTSSYHKLTDHESMQDILCKEPWVEALPRYAPLEGSLEQLKHEDWLGDEHAEFIDFLIELRDEGNRGGIFNPYLHQAKAMKAWADGNDLVVSTGTGSGKTECFLWPILGHLWNFARRVEAQDGEKESHRGVKAIVLYPMNALVADQLKRMRQSLGDLGLAGQLAGNALHQGGGPRFFQFGQYTGRTKFFGAYAMPTQRADGSPGNGRRNSKILASGQARKFIEKFVTIEHGASTGPQQTEALYRRMTRLGLIPSKGRTYTTDDGFDYSSLSEFGNPREHKTPLLTSRLDRELLMRHEMHNVGYQHLQVGGNPVITDEMNIGGTPDVLITNYSMLEYMLKRPLEHIIWHETKDWLNRDPDNKLLLILDEAHLYQGALGTEVGMLVRRLLLSLGITDPENKVQFILTSASLGDESEKGIELRKDFTRGLTGRSEEWMEAKRTSFITGDKWELPNDWTKVEVNLGEWLDVLSSGEGPLDDVSAKNALSSLDSCPLQDCDEEGWSDWFRSTDAYRTLYELTENEVMSMSDLSKRFWREDDVTPALVKATERLLNLVASLRGTDQVGRPNMPLLGVRAHLLFRGLPQLYWAIDTDELRLRDDEFGINDGSFQAVYPVRGCRKCGAPFINAWVSEGKVNVLRNGLKAAEPQDKVRTFSRPVTDSTRLEIYLVEEVDEDGLGFVDVHGRTVQPLGQPPHVWVHKKRNVVCTRHYLGDNTEEWRPGYLVTRDDEIRQIKDEANREAFGSQLTCLSFNDGSCPQCNSNHSLRRASQITDYMTRGDQAFAGLVSALHHAQDGDDAKKGLPNQGKKVLIFSDGRQRASRLAKAVQDISNYDEFRKIVLHLLHDEWYRKLSKRHPSLLHLYSFLVLHLTACNREPFEETAARYNNPREIFARNRNESLAIHIAGLTFLERYEGTDKIPISEDDELLRDLMNKANMALSELEKMQGLAFNYTEGAPASHDDFRDEMEQGEYYRALVDKSAKFVRNRVFIEIENDEDADTLFGSFIDLHIDNENQDYAPDVEAVNDKVRDFDLGCSVDEINEATQRWTAWIQNPTGDFEWSYTRKPKDIDYYRNTVVPKHQRILLSRINSMRDAVGNELRELRTKAMNVIMLEHQTLDNLAIIARSIKRVELEMWTGEATQQIEMHRNILEPMTSSLSEKGPDDYYTDMIDFLSSNDFSMEGLGLGHIDILTDIDQGLLSYYENEFGLILDEDMHNRFLIILAEMARWPIRAIMNQRDRNAEKRTRCLLSPGGRFGHRTAKRHQQARWLRRRDEWAVPPDRLETRYRELCKELEVVTNNGEPQFPLTEVIAHTRLFLHDGADQLCTNAESVRLVSVVDDQAKLVACRTCGTTTSHPYDVHRMRCLNCDDGTALEEYTPELPLLRQRIEVPWRIPALAAIESSQTDLDINLIRAEEHTAQINDNRDPDEMFTAAEKFELLFQDVPFVVPEEGERWSLPEAPVDVLSCTTTMEVGIDIGSLTAVALRTVPRERSNYQQRVGRAGRGKSEVCIALSWYDNVPHAQHYFANPAEILRHPDTSPIIYLENEEIVKRHVWAAILQTFFKRKRFDPVQRQFEGMDPVLSDANLMDSMGTVDDFFLDSDGEYCLDAFRKWIEDGGEADDEVRWEGIKEPIVNLLPDGLPEVLEFKSAELLVDRWVTDLFVRLDDCSEEVEADE